jgi:hypothetical protein
MALKIIRVLFYMRGRFDCFLRKRSAPASTQKVTRHASGVVIFARKINPPLAGWENNSKSGARLALI